MGSKGREGGDREDKGTGVVNANSGGQGKAKWEAREEKEETGKTREQV